MAWFPAPFIVALASCLSLAASSALAQATPEYPARSIKVVVPFPAGGATDTMTRNISQKLGEVLRQPMIVENRPGAGGTLGADAVAKSAADGYTLLAATIAHAANVSLIPNSPYQLQRDLKAVAIMGLIPLVPVVRTESSIHSLGDLVAASRSRNLNAGSSGNGTAAHLGLELFKSATGSAIQHVPYKGGAPAMVDLIGGQVDVIFALLPEALPHIRSGKLRALAVTSDQRYPLLPDVPTTAEAGAPGVVVTSWNGLMVPAATSPEVIAKLNAEIVKIVAAPEMKSRIIELGFQPVDWSAAQSDRFIAADVARWAKVVREASIKAD